MLCGRFRALYDALVDRIASLPSLPRPVSSRLNFWRVHFASFLFGSLAVGALFCAIDGLTFDAAWLLGVSCATCTGLAPLDFNKLSVNGQVLCWVCIALGSQVTTVLAIVSAKRFLYRRRGRAAPYLRSPVAAREPLPDPSHPLFIDLVEYHALRRLQALIVGYFVTWLSIALLAFVPYFNLESNARRALGEANVNPWWFSFFHAASSFYAAGLSPLPDSMAQFRHDRFVLLFTAFLSLLGGQLLPVGLFVLVRAAHRVAPGPAKLPFLYLIR
eukprot:tig00021441_g21548.t1